MRTICDASLGLLATLKCQSIAVFSTVLVIGEIIILIGILTISYAMIKDLLNKKKK